MSRWSRMLALVAVPFVLVALAPAVRADTPVVVPLLDCVTLDPDTGAVTADFGYVNYGTTTVDILYGSNNVFIQAPNFRKGQPTTFLPGAQHHVFQVTYNAPLSPVLTWYLDGVWVSASNDPSLYCGAPTEDDASLTMPASLTTTAGADASLTATVTDPKAPSVGTYGTVVYGLPAGLDAGTLPSGSLCTIGTGQVSCPISTGSDDTVPVHAATPGVYPVTGTFVSSQLPDAVATNNVATTAVRVTGTPTAVTGLAGAVTATGAELTGSANPAGVDTTGAFSYWPDGHPELAATAGSADLGDGFADVPLDAVLTGLTPGTTYDYEASAGTATGAQRSFTTPAAPAASAGLSVTGSTAPATVGTPVTQTFTVADGGPSDATGVQLTVNLPSGLGSITPAPGAGTCSVAATTVTCALGTVTSGSSVDVAVTGTPAAAGTLLTTAFVAGAEPDPAVADNLATTSTTVSPAAAPGADLSVTASGPSSAHGTITFTVVVRNAGPARANAVHLALSAANGRITSVSPFSHYCKAGMPAGCDLRSIAAGGVVTVTVKVTPTHLGPVTLTATGTSPTADPNPSDNSASATTRAR